LPRLEQRREERPASFAPGFEIGAEARLQQLFLDADLAPVGRCDQRDRDLAALGIVPLRLPYHDTVADSAGTVQKIIDFLNIFPTADQIDAAVKFVSPDLMHFGGTQ
jgi:hypothetical protein